MPVPGFLRSRSDSGAALAAISTCTSAHTPTSVHISPKRAVQARPVLGSDEAVRGVWFRVTDPVDTGDGPPPDTVAWRFDEADHRPRVHPDDDDAVQALASATRDKSADRKEIVVRFRAPDGGYSPHTVTSLPIDLDEHGADRPRLALVTLAECSSGGSLS